MSFLTLTIVKGYPMRYLITLTAFLALAVACVAGEPPRAYVVAVPTACICGDGCKCKPGVCPAQCPVASPVPSAFTRVCDASGCRIVSTSASVSTLAVTGQVMTYRTARTGLFARIRNR